MRTAILGLVILGAAFVAWNLSTRVETPSKPVAFRDFMRDVDAGKIDDVTIAGRKVSGAYRASGETFHTFAPAQHESLVRDLDARGIPTNVRE